MGREDDVIRARALMVRSHLTPYGPVGWGQPVPCGRKGVYIIETETTLERAPLDSELLGAWLDRMPKLELDGRRRPSVPDIDHRLATFWWRESTVLYIGQTSSKVSSRIDAFVRHTLGNSKPHRGGHWLKALSLESKLRVWWAESDTPDAAEAKLLVVYREWMRSLDHRLTKVADCWLLPFANLETEEGERKPHGFRGQTL